MTTPESRVKAKVRKTFAQEWPNSYRFMPVVNGLGAPSLDFLYCIEGKFIAIETKAPGKKLTPRQEITCEAIRAAGGQVYVVWDDASLEMAVRMVIKLIDDGNNTFLQCK